MPVGVIVEAIEVPASGTSIYNTANCFMLTITDWGPVGQAIPVTNLPNGVQSLGTPSGSSSAYGGRTTTCATAIDSIDTFFREDGPASPTLYVSRVMGPSPVAASLVLENSSSTASLTVTAVYPGVGGNGIYVQVNNTGSAYTLSLVDSLGNTLVATSPSFASAAAGVAWLATTGYVTAVAGTGLPATLAATALSSGSNGGSVTITQITNALAAFGPSLGPGQVIAPNWTNTSLSGIWSAIGAHALANNRVAVCDMDDDETASTLVTDLGSFGTSSVASYAGFWGGNRQVPGVVSNTTRSVPPSPVVSALCAQADFGGTPNMAAAGINYPLLYATNPESMVSGAPYDTYSPADLNTLNAASINTFQRVNGVPTNYGFVASVPPTTDQIYWQFNHARLRMFIVAQAQILGQPYVFAQLDGQGSKQQAFQTALDGLLMNPLWKAGALYGATASAAYTIDVGSDINTPATIAAGQLNAKITCSFSYFAQLITILINVQPISTTV